MKILVQGINYYPELTGIGKYTAEMCEWLAAQGHEVEVITAMPYYPNWSIHKDYKGKRWHTEKIKGVTVRRCPLYVPVQVTGMSRIIHEFSFAASTLPFWLNALFSRFDFIISVCPPFHLGFLALLFGKRAIKIYHVQDLQVDAARRLKLIKSNLLLRFLEKSEAMIMKAMTKVSSISDGMKKNILLKGVKEENYINLPNWVDVNFIQPLFQSQSLREKFEIPLNSKVVLYSGNMGEKQGLEMVLDVADNLKDRKDILFIMVGEGANKLVLQSKAQGRHLTNIRFYPLQPYKELSAMLAMADLHLVIQKKAAADLVLPSKLMTLLAAGGVALVTAEKETSLYDLIKDNQIGILTEPENVDALTESIKLHIDQDMSIIKKNARNYAVNSLSIDQILTNFESNLKKLLN